MRGNINMKNYGVYIREVGAQAWQLEEITNKEKAHVAEEANVNFGVQTLIVGPLSTFPKWLET